MQGNCKFEEHIFLKVALYQNYYSSLQTLHFELTNILPQEQHCFILFNHYSKNKVINIQKVAHKVGFSYLFGLLFAHCARIYS
jgi:hypothetical protein